MKVPHVAYGIASTLLLLGSGCVAKDTTMEAQSSGFGIDLMMLLAVVLATGAVLGTAIATVGFRKSPASGFLASVLLVAILGVGAVAVWVYQERRVEVHRAEARARLRAIGEELRRVEGHREAIAPEVWISLLKPNGEPIDNSEPAEVSLGDGESLILAPSQPLPEWVEAGTVAEGDRKRVVLSGRQFADPETAQQDALAQATDLVQWDFDAERGYVNDPDVPSEGHWAAGASGSWGSWTRGGPSGRSRAIEYSSDIWTLVPSVVRSAAVKQSHTEEIRRTAGDNEFTVYRTHLLVELSPEVRNLVQPVWREQVSASRSVVVAGLIALLTAIAGVVSGYFRLDDRTGGRYRWPLRFGALVAIAIVGTTVAAGTNVADEYARRGHPVQPIEVSPPVEHVPNTPALPVQPTPLTEPIMPIEVTLSCDEQA